MKKKNLSQHFKTQLPHFSHSVHISVLNSCWWNTCLVYCTSITGVVTNIVTIRTILSEAQQQGSIWAGFYIKMCTEAACNWFFCYKTISMYVRLNAYLFTKLCDKNNSGTWMWIKTHKSLVKKFHLLYIVLINRAFDAQSPKLRWLKKLKNKHFMYYNKIHIHTYTNTFTLL